MKLLNSPQSLEIISNSPAHNNNNLKSVIATEVGKHKKTIFIFTSSIMATILFDSSKNELFKLTDNYKTVNRKLKANYKTDV